MSGMKNKGLYLYCLVPGSVPRGIGVSLRGFSALVEQVSLNEFWGDNIKKNLTDKKWLETKILKHNRVISEAAKKWAVIPMKFGTVFESEGSLQKTLNEKAGQFVSLLSTLKGKEEWGAKLFCNMEKFKDIVSTMDDDVIKMRMEIKDKPAGVAYFMKKKIEKLIEKRTELIVDKYVIETHEKLSQRSFRSCLNKLQSRGMTKRKDKMVLNGAYLVEKKKIGGFNREISNLQKGFEKKGFQIELSGPWPSYSFVNLEQEVVK